MDALGREIKVTDNGSGTRTLKTSRYTLAGLLASTTDIHDKSTAYQHDEFGRKTQEVYPLGNIRTIKYDDAKQTVHRYTNDIQVSSTTVDGVGNVIAAVRHSEGNKPKMTVVDYNGFGQKTSVTEYLVDSDGKLDNQFSIEYRSNPEGQVVFKKFTGRDGIEATSSMDYDADKSLISKKLSIKDANGQTTTHTLPERQYDKAGQLTRVAGKTLEYDDNGLPIQETWQHGHNIHHVRNANGEITQTTWLNNGLSQHTRNEYNESGNIIKCSSQDLI